MIKLNFQRQEYKYLLNREQYQQVRHYLLQRGLLPDTYSDQQPQNRYYLASLYLDTPDYQAYWEKKHGVYRRTKYRLRTYAKRGKKETPIFWEVKSKFGNWQKKDRFQLSWGKTQVMLAASAKLDDLQAGASDQALLTKYYFAWIKNNLRPTLLISYQREPLIDQFYPDFRLTFDSDIQALPTVDLFSPCRLRPVLPDQVIMEIKFTGSIPGYMAQINQYFSFSRLALSKYCLGLEACDIVAEENQ